MPRMVGLAVVLAACAPRWAALGVPPDPRADPYWVVPGLRALMEWASFQLTFDGETLTPDMALGAFSFSLHGTPRFVPGVKGQALLAGGETGFAIYPRELNAPLESCGAVALWLCPVAWTHENGDNTEFVMTTNSSFYLQRQGPLHNPDGSLVRAEGVQFLMLSEVTGNHCLMFGTQDWKPGVWRLVVANWNWPVMSFSLDGGEFQSVSVKQNPSAANFGGLMVGSVGGEETLMDEVIIFRRPLRRDEAQALYAALKAINKETEQ